MRSVQSYVEISPFLLGKSGFPSAVDNRFFNHRLRDKSPQERDEQ